MRSARPQRADPRPLPASARGERKRLEYRKRINNVRAPRSFPWRISFSITKTSSSSSTISTWPNWPRCRKTISPRGGDPAGYAPRDAADAVDNYRRVLEIVGEVAGEMIAPNAEQVDREGNTLNEDGTVTLHPLVQQEPRAARARPT